MGQLIRIGVDTSKTIFQLHGVDETERTALVKKLRRSELLAFFATLEPIQIGLEACGASHHWARQLAALGHEPRLIAPQHVKAYRRRAKHDAADAEAICEAMSRPRTRFAPVKTAADQARLMALSVREQLIARRTRLANAIRGHAAEFGLVAPRGLAHIEPLLERLAEADDVPDLAKEMFAALAEDYRALAERLAPLEKRVKALARQSEAARRLMAIPGVGPIGALLLALKAPQPHAFGSGRDFAAWMGLTPKNHSTAGRARLGAITRAGDERLRAVLVAGATAHIQHARRPGRASPWLAALLARKTPKLAAVALANKTARIAWKMLTTGEAYRPGDQSLAQRAGAAGA